ncbi:UDP-glycosyltransferase 90A1-like [Camellia sinensis]|uniref:UDP-glycosyltransferase 90A1-like n=1 Tax=Camellia sinensis TaxID=4442 RepID=UPI001035CA0C|nr:UDP-glycosyltransferase 90A1-like [Camellia sinensis]
MAIGKATSLHSPCIRAMLDSDPINLSQVKVLFSLKRADLPNSLQKGNADADSWGFIVNSFEELEGEYVATLESFFKKKSYAWCVGQLLLVNQIEQEATSDDQLCWYIKWLNKQLRRSGVICISFGTQAHVSNTQMDEIAMGLEMASHPFIWVVPSTKWTPPDGWEERVKERGLIAKDWVEQRSILAHPSMGGFLSRCGWNSVLESLLNGIPMLGWPMGAKQGLNAKYVADGLGAGILVDPQPQGRRRVGTEGINTIEHDVICHKVKELMSREREESPREGTRIGDYGKASYGERWIIPQEAGQIDRSA